MNERATSHKVRIGQRGWKGDEIAETTDDVQVGLACMWVEIDGHRFTGIGGASVEISGDGFTLPSVTIHAIGPVEIVYTDNDGDPLPGRGDVPIVVDGEGSHQFDAYTEAVPRDGVVNLAPDVPSDAP